MLMKRKNVLSQFKRRVILALGLGLSTLAYSSYAQVSLTSLAAHSQNFDGLPSTSPSWSNNVTLPGWYSSRTGTISPNNGSSNTTGLYSFGTTSATDRALGSAGSGTSTAYGLLLQNNTTSTINSFTIQYAMEVWRRGSGNTTVNVDFAYKLNETSLSATGYTAVA